MSRHTEQQIAALADRVAALEAAADCDDLEDAQDDLEEAAVAAAHAIREDAQDAPQADDDGTPDGPYREELGGGWWAVVDADGNVSKVQGADAAADALAAL